MLDATGDGLPQKVQSASKNLYWEEGFCEPAFARVTRLGIEKSCADWVVVLQHRHRNLNRSHYFSEILFFLCNIIERSKRFEDNRSAEFNTGWPGTCSSQTGEQPLFKSSIELSCWIWNWKYTTRSISDRNLVR